MHIITSEGKIIEGQELTTDEASILKELTESGLNAAATGLYVPQRAAEQIAKYLIENFRITRRQQPEVDPKPIDAEYAEVAEPVEAARH